MKRILSILTFLSFYIFTFCASAQDRSIVPLADPFILLDGDKQNLKREDEISGELYDLELSTGILISPMIMLRKQWENRPFKTPFYVNVMNEGIKI